jgi:drug/metabolite transporter (DMT)-like permease
VIVALVLVSAFLHALWNALLRVEPDKDRGLVGATTIATLVAAVVAAVRWLGGSILFTGLEPLAWAIAAGVLEWVYLVALARALDKGALGPVYTLSRGGAILVVWPLSVSLLGEAVTIPAIAGSAVVLAGLALAGTGSGDPRGTQRSALAWACLCATAIAGYHLAYKEALAAGGNPSAIFAVALGLASAINLARTRGAVGYSRGRLPRVAMMGVVCAASFLVLLEALATGGAGFVLTLRNTSVLFATCLAFAIGERPRRAQVSGAVLVAAGTVLMAWPGHHGRPSPTTPPPAPAVSPTPG